jgi:hypothetical protein
MASSKSTDTNHPLSIAAAKLERQNKRIEATNAALLAQVPSEKQKQQPRPKGKAWKPFDFATEANDAGPTQQQQIDAPAVETRVNVFRVPSQGNMLSRPISRISSHTQSSSYAESERRDSSFLESDDFQIFTGRKKSRAAIPTFNEKPTQQNPTVEATFSKRDITDVFGNELPGPGFMDGNPGTLDGQLQFIQHPNGDVSAHQWSASRFGWENIGQFSNIRKKIEGQLAADRLKGETAWQSLQQNTLAYFRTVAKQREADAMGLPFTVKDIAACLPDTRPPSTAPTGPRRITSKVEMPERPATMMSRQESLSPEKTVGAYRGPASMPPRPTFDPPPRSQAAPQQLDARLNPARHFTPTARENTKDDPFVSDSTLHQPYGYPYANNMHDQHMGNWSAYHSWNNPMNPMNMYYQGYAMPHMSYPNHGYIPHAPRPLYDQNNADDQTSRWRAGLQPQQHQYSDQQTQQHIPSYQTSRPNVPRESPYRPTTHFDSPPKLQTQDAGPSVQPASIASSKPASPLDTRSAMRVHVMKMGEQAKERTKSQANVGRTVLYDPFQDVQQRDLTPEPVKQESPPKPFKQESTPKAVKQELPPKPTPKKENLGNLPLPGLSMIPGLGRLSGNGQAPFPTTLAPSIQMPFNATSALSENDLRDSSPDREWERETAETGNEQDMPSPQPKYLDQWDPVKLNEWLWSGNKFSRQEDFHQRIMATDATPNRRKHASTTETTNPIAPPSRSGPTSSTYPNQPTPDPNSNVLTNRLLVPVLENLASYVQGPIEKRRDYFCQWVKAPDWAIDRSATGNESFFDSQWGQPPERFGRDPRRQPVPRALDVRFGGFEARGAGQAVAMPGRMGAERRFGYGGGGRF